MDDTRYRRRAAILFGDIGDDVVALSVERGLCYGMEQVTAAVWTLLEQPRSLEEICARLADDYDVGPDQCRSEIGALLAEMQDEGLVERMA